MEKIKLSNSKKYLLIRKESENDYNNNNWYNGVTDKLLTKIPNHSKYLFGDFLLSTYLPTSKIKIKKSSSLLYIFKASL